MRGLVGKWLVRLAVVVAVLGAVAGGATMEPGLLEGAHQGVLLLDEVGELPLAVQAKLLRVLDTRCVMRLGELRERAFDARIVSATNRSLEDEVAAGGSPGRVRRSGLR